jgi:type I site-specific restriction endonuclease
MMHALSIGLTAIPKETRDVSTLTYFSEPIYESEMRCISGAICSLSG